MSKASVADIKFPETSPHNDGQTFFFLSKESLQNMCLSGIYLFRKLIILYSKYYFTYSFSHFVVVREINFK